MNKDIEKELEELGETYSTINVPKNIDGFIQKGIDRGRMRKRRNIRKKLLGLTAAVFAAILVTSIRISPAFAAYLSEIPGLSHLVNIVNFDKGLELAIENNFIQHINIYDEHEGISFTVDDIIIDESRMIIFYTIDKGERKYVNINNIDFLDEKGNLLQAAFSYPGFIDEDMEEQQIVKNQIDIGFVEETIIPDVLKMKVKLMESPLSWSEFRQQYDQLQEHSIRDRDRYTELAGTWEIDIPIDKEQFNAIREVYPIDKTVEIQGQRIYFDTLIIYPTRMVLDVRYDERNTIKLFDFEGLKITDEKGEWLTISNGMSASIIDDYSKKIYFQSNYFNKPKEIYLEWEAIRGLDKDRLEVIVDLDKQELLKNPDNKLLFDGMCFLNGRAGKGENKEILFKFLLEKNDGMPYMHYQILEGSFYDVTGKKIESMGYSTSASVKNDKVYEEIGYHIPADINIKSPITFKIIDYPNRIKIPHRLKIK